MTAVARKALTVTAVALLLYGGRLEAQVYSPGSGVTPPRVLRSAPMPRPASQVVVECVIEADGTLASSKIVRPGAAEDDQAILTAIAQWQFEAGTKDGRPVAVRFYLSFPRSR